MPGEIESGLNLLLSEDRYVRVVVLGTGCG